MLRFIRQSIHELVYAHLVEDAQAHSARWVDVGMEEVCGEFALQVAAAQAAAAAAAMTARPGEAIDVAPCAGVGDGRPACSSVAASGNVGRSAIAVPWGAWRGSHQ
jgi:hypothetical protein